MKRVEVVRKAVVVSTGGDARKGQGGNVDMSSVRNTACFC